MLKIFSFYCFLNLLLAVTQHSHARIEISPKVKKTLVITASVIGLITIGTTGKILYDIKSNKPKLPENKTPTKKRILLVGDSILDNAYWNDVDAHTTGEELLKTLGKQGWVVDDRSTEEASTPRFLKAIKNKQPVIVRSPYVSKRRKLGIPYNPKTEGTARIAKYHTQNKNLSMNVDVHSDVAGSHVFMSLGGNDIGLLHNLNPYSTCNNLAKIAKYYKEQGAASVNLIYPYTPTKEMAGNSKIGLAILKGFHRIMKPAINTTINHSAIDNMIDLSDFTDQQRAGDHIPEPTRAGAIEISKRIAMQISQQNP
ncbi:MAG: hypothetical protein OXE99_02380 [Cellvibrionales bacterium]|nr:hypothetical protein [Cellvibrionales bacterium]